MEGRARTEQEKRVIIQRLLVAWISLPELRLGQLIDNSISTDKDLFFLEDKELIELVEKTVKFR